MKLGSLNIYINPIVIQLIYSNQFKSVHSTWELGFSSHLQLSLLSTVLSTSPTSKSPFKVVVPLSLNLLPIHDLHDETRCKLALSKVSYKLSTNNGHRLLQNFDVNSDYVMALIQTECYPRDSFNTLHARAFRPLPQVPYLKWILCPHFQLLYYLFMRRLTSFLMIKLSYPLMALSITT